MAEATWGKRPCSEKELIGILESVVLGQQWKELTNAQEKRKNLKE